MENYSDSHDDDLYVPDEREDIEGHACKALNLTNRHRGRHLLNLVKEAMPNNSLQACREPLMKESTVAAYEAFDPQDEQERILSSEMITIHDHVMDCFKRAKEDGLDPRLRHEELRHAERLCALTARLSEALDKHRGKGQQKVTVEHFLVEQGGQDTLRNVRTDSKADSAIQPTELEYSPDFGVPLDNSIVARVRQRQRK